MGQKRAPGLRLRNGVWHIDKIIQGRKLAVSTRTGNLKEAEMYLAKRVEEIRQANLYGVRPSWKFKEAAAKYLRENMHKRSISDAASRLKSLLSYIADLPLNRIHDGTLAPYIRDKRRTLKSKTINNNLEIVRRILNCAARRWRDDNGNTWLETAPLITMLEVTDARRPYPLSWDEQQYLLRELPPHLAEMVLFKVNTGTREQEVVHLRWDWECRVPELDTSVFIIPGEFVKNKEDRIVVLNRVAQSVIEEARGRHPSRVFVYKGRPITKIYNSAWKRAREDAAEKYARDKEEAIAWGFAHLRVHDLKHTFGRRLRAAGVALETRKVLLGHTNGDITTHYSAPEIGELIAAANRVCREGSGKIPALTLLKTKTG